MDEVALGHFFFSGDLGRCLLILFQYCSIPFLRLTANKDRRAEPGSLQREQCILEYRGGLDRVLLSNRQIAKELKITPILDKLQEYKRNWIQHVNRMPRNRLPKVMKQYSPTGRRNHGGPLKRLLDAWDGNGSTSGPTPWKIDDDYYYYHFFPQSASKELYISCNGSVPFRVLVPRSYMGAR